MNELKDWLRLIRTPGLGARRLRPLLKHYGKPSRLIAAGRELRQFSVPAPAIDALSRVDNKQLETDLRWLTSDHNHLITIDSEQYPPQLKEISDAPVALFVVGDPSALWLPQLAVVGSRNATQAGLANARAFARLIAGQGLLVTSGLALGVDSSAHRGALAAPGRTIAVAGTGLDRVYPAKNQELATKIADSGAIVSEYPLGTQPRPGHFPARNRIISGLSLGTLVVEASVGSGSLITAEFATEQGRDVFSIPGSIHNPLARGCHQLIKQGAKLVESGEDLYEELKSSVASHLDLIRPQLQPAPIGPSALGIDTIVEPRSLEPNNELDDDYKILMKAIGFDPVTIDQLVDRTELSINALSSMLLILELDGYISQEPGGSYCRGEATAGRTCQADTTSGVTTQ